ncbi:hypothetical protein DXG01_012702 [Tephrocybe rancida]|nr:hypothetical protein DXG01_012702 [Tephrocybe rancida]
MYKKCHGLIYLEDNSMPAPAKLSPLPSRLLEKCVKNQNIVIATLGWDDTEFDMNKLETRDVELLLQWRPFVLRGATVLRLSAAQTSRGASSHEDIVNLVITNAGLPMQTSYRVPKTELDPRDTDIVIPVMGPSGAGKSTFINYTIGQDLAPVGVLLESETVHVQPFVLPHPTDATRRIVLVDTPGFDDSKVDDLVILRRIADWLVQSQPRMFGTLRDNLTMFSELIGQKVTENVAIVTTKWGDSNHNILEERQK